VHACGAVGSQYIIKKTGHVRNTKTFPPKLPVRFDATAGELASQGVAN